MKRPIDLYVINYLKQVSAIMPKRPGNKYGTFEGFYLAEGHLYPHKPYTRGETLAILKGLSASGDFNPAVKQCFYNAQQLALSGGFGYAEGYAYPEGLPIAIHHAWAVHNGKPVDVTLRTDHGESTGLRRKLLTRTLNNLGRVAYYGVEFPKDMIWKIWNTERIARPVIDDPKHGFPLLQHLRR